jgi:hypothetical protein
MENKMYFVPHLFFVNADHSKVHSLDIWYFAGKRILSTLVFGDILRTDLN